MEDGMLEMKDPLNTLVSRMESLWNMDPDSWVQALSPVVVD